MISIQIYVYFVPFLLDVVLAIPGYGSYSYDGHGHSGYNAVGNNYKVDNYYSKPQYAFGYEVDDYYSQLSHGRWEVRDGDVTQGQYRVLLPDGRLQVVSYIADKGGYRPTIRYFGKGVHPPPPPAYAKIKPPKGIPDPYLNPTGPLIQPTPHLILPTRPIKVDLPLTGFESQPQQFHDKVNFNQNFGNHQHDQLYFSPSSKTEVKLSPENIFRRRALLYDRTLFRRDIPEPPTKPR